MSGCPAFSSEGPAGIADALRSVDCLAAEATASAFDRLFGAHSALGGALTILLTLYVALLAVNLLTGRSALNLSMLTPRMLVLGMALTFATSWVAYQSVVWNLAVGAPDQIASLLVGTKGSATIVFADRLDMLFGVVAQAAEAAQVASAGKDKSASFTPADLLWLAALMLLLGTVGVLLVARIALAALLAVGPVFIILALFRGTHGLFEGWLKAVVLFAIVPLFTVLVGGGAVAMMSPVIESMANVGGEPSLRSAVTVFLAASVYMALMAMVLKLASTLTAGWRLPWSGDTRPADQPATGNGVNSHIAQQTILASGMAAPADNSEQSRVRSIVSGMAVPANDHMPSGATIEPIRTSIPVPVAVGVPMQTSNSGDDRVRGLGVQFRPRPAPPASKGLR